MQNVVKAETEIKVDERAFDTIVSSARKGSINYWCDEVKNEDGCILKIREQNNTWVLNRDNLIKGVKLYVKNAMRACVKGCIEVDGDGCSLNAEHIDGYTADAIIQFALFGDIVFG